MIKSKTLILTIFLISSLTAHTQVTSGPINTIVTAVPFIGISSSINLGMGNVNVVATEYNTQGGASHNPARMAQSKANISASYTNWLAALDLPNVYISETNGHVSLNERHSIGLHYKRFSLGNIQFTDPNGMPLGSSEPEEFYTGLAYTFRATKHLSIGINTNYIYSNLADGFYNGFEIRPAQAFSVGTGVFYQNEFDSNIGLIQWSAGGAITNIGSAIRYTDNSYGEKLPANAAIGGTIGIKNLVSGLDVHLAYQADKLLVPTPTSLDGNNNNIYDYKEYSLISSILISMNDAPGGLQEEAAEISHSFGLETMYHFSDIFRFGLHFGGFYEDETKGNRKYLTTGGSLNIYGFYLNAGYILPRRVRTSPLDKTLSVCLGYQLDI